MKDEYNHDTLCHWEASQHDGDEVAAFDLFLTDNNISVQASPIQRGPRVNGHIDLSLNKLTLSSNTIDG